MSNENMFAQLPAIEKLLSSPRGKEWETRLIHPVRVRLAQEFVAELREKLKRGEEIPSLEEIESKLMDRFEETLGLGMKKVINATGVLLEPEVRIIERP